MMNDIMRIYAEKVSRVWVLGYYVWYRNAWLCYLCMMFIPDASICLPSFLICYDGSLIVKALGAHIFVGCLAGVMHVPDMLWAKVITSAIFWGATLMPLDMTRLEETTTHVDFETKPRLTGESCKSLETHTNSSCKFRFHDALCAGKLRSLVHLKNV